MHHSPGGKAWPRIVAGASAYTCVLEHAPGRFPLHGSFTKPTVCLCKVVPLSWVALCASSRMVVLTVHGMLDTGSVLHARWLISNADLLDHLEAVNQNARLLGYCLLGPCFPPMLARGPFMC
eukprot:1159590-Pelagomonas_calceolata.AAC.5